MKLAKPACVALVLSAAALSGCEREKRSFPTPRSNEVNAVASAAGMRMSGQQPSAARTDPVKDPAANASPYEQNAYAVNQGKRLFRWYNCNGCHGSGGGSIGPALMDAEWVYGSDPANVFESIERGRPNGMPSFGGHIPDDQVWQIVAYVRSMSGQLRSDVAPQPEASRNREVPRPAPPEPQPK
jgi:cytochrome c oxidase cbb3-type subunit 3